MKPSLSIKSLLIATTFFTPLLQAQDAAPTKTREIEQKVLQRQYLIALKALAGSADAGQAEASPDVLQKRLIWLAQLKGQIGPGGMAFAKDQEEITNDANKLNVMAWKMVSSANVAARHPDIALKLATLALELGGQDKNLKPDVLETMARALFLLGKHKEAIKTQGEAVAACGDNDSLKSTHEITLNIYKQGKVPAAAEQQGRSNGATGAGGSASGEKKNVPASGGDDPFSSGTGGGADDPFTPGTGGGASGGQH